MEIIKRLALGWEREDEYGKYQYIYRPNTKHYFGISLVYLKCRGRKFMWETHSIQESSERFSKRFNTKEEAEEYIIEVLVGDDLKDLVACKIAKNNIIIVE